MSIQQNSDSIKWTPAPWRVDGPSNSFTVVRDYTGDGGYGGGGITIQPGVGSGTICTLTWTERDKPERMANAQLIAAAPDLYEAARRLLFKFKDDACTCDGEQCDYCFARAALAKARGEATE